MTIKIIGLTFLGGVLGYFFPNFSNAIDPIVSVALLLMLFFVGLDFGQDRTLYEHIKKEGPSLLIFPVLIALGSLGGSIIAGMFLPITILESVTVGSAFGWYSLSGPLLSKMVSEPLGTIAFLANLMRELLTFLLVPLLAKVRLDKNGVKALTFSPAGATSMDVTLGVIHKATETKTAIAAFISGAVLSMLAPILLQFFISLMI
ncbi:MAG: lysine exporter LysO family protein [Bacillota bacterium]